jgi:thermitase
MDYSYRVDGKVVTLDLDPSVVAVHFKPGPKSFRAAAIDAAGVGPFTQRFEVPGEELTLVPSAEVTVAAVPPTIRMAAGAMASLNAQPGVGHALPVFRMAGNQVVTTDRVIVGTTSSAVGERLAEKHGLEILSLEDDRLLARVAEGVNPFAIINAISAEQGVRYAEPDFVTIGRHIPKRIAASVVPLLSDPLLPKQYAMALVRATDAWTVQSGDRDVVVAILDEGVQSAHPDLKSALIGAFDATQGDSDQEPNRWDGHGTACAGLALATGGNGIGIRGVAAGVSLLAVRIAYSERPDGPWVTTNSKIRDGIRWAWQNGADILSNSWGGGAPSSDISGEFDKARTQGRGGLGCVVVIAAGNSFGDVTFPANLPDVLTVSASNEYDEAKTPTSKDGETWWGTCHGPEIDVAAPGVHNMTTDISAGDGYAPDDYTPNFNGTSSATPIVAGACALVISANRKLSGADVAQIITYTAAKVGPYPYPGGRNDFFGAGRLDVYAAVTAARRTPGASGSKQRKPFGEGEAEALVLAAAKKKTGLDVGLSDKVSEEFTDAYQVRLLMGTIQDLLINAYEIWINLASGPDSEMTAFGKLSYRVLANEVFQKAAAQ